MQLQGYLSEISKALFLDLKYYFHVGIVLLTPQLKSANMGVGSKTMNQHMRVQGKTQEIFINT